MTDTLHCSRLGCAATIRRSDLPGGWTFLDGKPFCPDCTKVGDRRLVHPSSLEIDWDGEDTIDADPEDP